MIYKAKSLAFNNYEPIGDLLVETYKTAEGELLVTDRYYIRESEINNTFT